jgi:hypothetical protein
MLGKNRKRELKMTSTFLSCDGQAGTLATRADVGENNERDTVREQKTGDKSQKTEDRRRMTGKRGREHF